MKLCTSGDEWSDKRVVEVAFLHCRITREDGIGVREPYGGVGVYLKGLVPCEWLGFNKHREDDEGVQAERGDPLSRVIVGIDGTKVRRAVITCRT